MRYFLSLEVDTVFHFLFLILALRIPIFTPRVGTGVGLWSVSCPALDSHLMDTVLSRHPQPCLEPLYWEVRRESARFPDVGYTYCGIPEDQEAQSQHCLMLRLDGRALWAHDSDVALGVSFRKDG